MPRVRLAAQAQFDLARLHQFLDEQDTVTAKRAILVIRQAFKTLEYAPVIYRPAHDDPSFREMVIEFGASGYVALYDYDSAAQVSTIYAVKHQLENDYKVWPTRA